MRRREDCGPEPREERPMAGDRPAAEPARRHDSPPPKPVKRRVPARDGLRKFAKGLRFV